MEKDKKKKKYYLIAKVELSSIAFGMLPIFLCFPNN